VRRLQQALVDLLCMGALGGLAWLMWLKAGQMASYGDITAQLKLPLPPFVYLMSVLCAVTAALHGLLNGHPYLTRVAFYTLVAGQMSWPELTARAIDENSPFHPHLHWQLRRIEDDPRLLAGVIEAVQNRPHSDPQVGYHLMKAGLVNKEGHNYVCRCELYRRYFADRLNVRASR